MKSIPWEDDEWYGVEYYHDLGHIADILRLDEVIMNDTLELWDENKHPTLVLLKLSR